VGLNPLTLKKVRAIEALAQLLVAVQTTRQTDKGSLPSSTEVFSEVSPHVDPWRGYVPEGKLTKLSPAH